jgi:transcriptional regulator with XRE-family HTH domain
MDFGPRLNHFRKQRSLTVAEVARRIQVSESTYRDWENGRAIKGEPYIKLAGVFEISLNDLFGLSDSGSTESTNIDQEVESIVFLHLGVLLVMGGVFGWFGFKRMHTTLN